ncbi:TIGR01457 family HAD-type hydrolase [Xylocopilactobacillus apis]|uniref:Acid sugar phosphatase n=1 Tax=Xylocopilactobacillus apis TaxID=2932183 RepID=A0AAU9DDV4_9LACO|nr:TIGR01457 family HAD-type hydrolase [Xylocopilactobacillus apis]BDR56341.1 acid sugar phosphatase [Xylocopilactobacillus apis]
MNEQKYLGYIIDLDGTIYLGKNKIPEAAGFINRLLKEKINFRLVTNNTTRTPAAILEMLNKYHNIDVPISSIYTAAKATADYIEKNKIKKNPHIYIIGENGLKTELYSRGFVYDEVNPDYVVIGLDQDVTYRKFEIATLAIENGAAFIGTNPDRVIPNEKGLVPSAGALIKLVEFAVNIKPIIIGKPNVIMLNLIAEELGIKKDNLILFGDNYNTDIKGGLNSDIDTALVLTGVSDKRELANVERQPTYVLNNLGEWNFV